MENESCLGVNHITISVRSLERSFRFYADVVGLKPKLKWSCGAYFVAGNVWVALHQEVVPMARSGQSYSHLAFTVTENRFAAIRSAVVSGEISEWQENKTEGDSIYFLDPDGHQLEVHKGSLESRLQRAQEMPWDTFEFFQ